MADILNPSDIERIGLISVALAEGDAQRVAELSDSPIYIDTLLRSLETLEKTLLPLEAGFETDAKFESLPGGTWTVEVPMRTQEPGSEVFGVFTKTGPKLCFLGVYDAGPGPWVEKVYTLDPADIERLQQISEALAVRDIERFHMLSDRPIPYFDVVLDYLSHVTETIVPFEKGFEEHVSITEMPDGTCMVLAPLRTLESGQGDVRGDPHGRETPELMMTKSGSHLFIDALSVPFPRTEYLPGPPAEPAEAESPPNGPDEMPEEQWEDAVELDANDIERIWLISIAIAERDLERLVSLCDGRKPDSEFWGTADDLRETVLPLREGFLEYTELMPAPDGNLFLDVQARTLNDEHSEMRLHMYKEKSSGALCLEYMAFS